MNKEHLFSLTMKTVLTNTTGPSEEQPQPLPNEIPHLKRTENVKKTNVIDRLFTINRILFNSTNDE